MGVALVPAFATLLPRLFMPEGKKFMESQALNTPASSGSSVQHNSTGAKIKSEIPVVPSAPSLRTSKKEFPSAPDDTVDLEILAEPKSRKAKLDAFFVYFSEWRHLKTLLGTTSTWFLLDIAFYGTNLNQSVLLADIGFSTGKTHYDVLMRNAIGNLIIAIAGYVPGYFFTIFLIEKMGRKWIQIQGFLVAGLMFAILAGGYSHLGTAGKFVCFAIAQVYIHSSHMSESTLTGNIVLFQFRPQCNNFHYSCRSLPDPRKRLRSWPLSRYWESRGYSLCSSFQLLVRGNCYWTRKRSVDILRL
jgi:PHS family inorganic phosphate transporter-like MFS transporter